MRPVRRGAQPATYAPPTNLKFIGANATTMKAILGTDDPTLTACLDVWLKVVRSWKRKPKNYKDWVEAKKAIEARVEAIYKTAGVPLIGVIGEYCSYCGTRIPGLLEVEHVLPKAQYPTFAADWNNFLLSCGPCNNCKSDNPKRNTVRRWLGVDVTNESQCEAEIRRRFIWPDINPQSHQHLLVVLFHDPLDNNVWSPVPIASARDSNNTIDSVDVATRVVRANIPALNLPNVKVLAKVIPTPQQVTAQGGQPTLVIPAGAREVIDLCGLNDLGTTSSTYDRRVFNRTKVWFDALASLSILGLFANQVHFGAVWSTVGLTAKNAGFFSVWVRVFQGAADPAGVDLAQRFIDDFAGDFLGTDISNLP